MLNDDTAIGEIDMLGDFLAKIHLVGTRMQSYRSAASSLMVTKTSLTVRGPTRRWTSSNSITSGFIARTGQSRHALLPARQTGPDRSLPCPRVAPSSAMRERVPLRRSRLLQNLQRGHHHVLERRLMGEKVVLLEDHPDLLPERQLVQPRIMYLLPLLLLWSLH